MKVALVRGNCLNKWDMQYYPNLKDFNIYPTGICSEDNKFNISGIGMPIIKLKRFGQYNKIPVFSKINNYFLCYNHYFFGFEKAMENFDLIHSVEIHNPFTYQAVNTGKPTIVTCWENIPFNSNRWNFKKFKKDVKEKAKYFIAVTEKAKEVLRKEGIGSERISIIPPGLDTKKFKPTIKNENDKVTILFVGRLVEEKGILDLMNSVSGLDIKLKVVGDGPLKKEVIGLARRFGTDMEFLDSVDYFKMPEIYNSCDIFCLPSKPNKIWEEQFGYSLIEAMACGKPVVSTLSGSIHEVVDKKIGILVKPGSVEELRSALIKLIEDKKLRENSGKNGRKRVLEKYDGNVVVKQIKEVYENYL